MSAGTVQAFAAIVGSENVFELDDSRATIYRDRLASFERPVPEVGSAILPGSVEELQQCVEFAGEKGVGIWVMPNAAGNGLTPGPAKGEAVFIDLRRMNRILEVSTSGAYALVEPGVSFLQLNDYLEEQGLNLWADCDRNGNNSIAGSILSRQTGYTPYGERMMMQCGMEVVLSNGSLVRTGTGAMPNDKTWQLFKRNFGPYVDGLFSASANGIASKIGLWIMPEPPVYRPFMITLPNHELLADVVELLRPLKQSMAVPGTIVISHAAFDVAPYSQRDSFVVDGKVDVTAISDKHKVGVWNLYGAFYGTQKLVDISWAGFSRAIDSVSGVNVFVDDERGDDPVWRGREPLMRATPAASDIDLSGWGGSAYLLFTAASPQEGEHALRMHEIANAALVKYQADYLSEFLLSGRTLFKRIYLPYEFGDKESARAAREAGLAVAAELTSSGYGIVGESPELTAPLNAQFGVSELGNLSARINRTLDPSGLFTDAG